MELEGRVGGFLRAYFKKGCRLRRWWVWRKAGRMKSMRVKLAFSFLPPNDYFKPRSSFPFFPMRIPPSHLARAHASRTFSTSILRAVAANKTTSSSTRRKPSRSSSLLLPLAVSKEVAVNPVLQKIIKDNHLGCMLAGLGKKLGNGESPFTRRRNSK